MNSEELKKLLREGEEVYNPKAWSKLSQKLDR